MKQSKEDKRKTEKDSPEPEQSSEGVRIPHMPLWGLAAIVTATIIFAFNIKVYVFTLFFTFLFILSAFVKVRFNIKPVFQFLIIVVVMGGLALISKKTDVMKISSMSADFLNMLVFYLGILCLVTIAIKVYKPKTVSEMHTAYLLALSVVLISSLNSPWKWDPVNGGLFFVFGVSSVMYFLEVEYISRKTVKTATPYSRSAIIPLYIIIPSLIALSLFFGKTMKEYEPQTLKLLVQKYAKSFYSFSSSVGLGRIKTLLQSDKMAMKVVTKRTVSRIRGHCYNKYVNGVWKTEAPREKMTPIDAKIKADLKKPNLSFSKWINSKKLLGKDPQLYTITGHAETDPEILKKLTTERYIIDIRKNDLVYYPEGSLFISLPPNAFTRDALGNIYGPFASLKEYDLAVLSDRRINVGDPESGPNEKDLQIPQNLKDKFKKKALQIIGDRKSPMGKAFAIEQYLQKNYKYNLGISLQRKDMDPVEEFLFFKRPAHCEYFASSMTLLLRSVGVPSRYVVGFISHEYDKSGGYYLVREKDAHAWVLVHVPGRGWTVFDPTPPSGRPNAQKRSGPGIWEYVKAKFSILISFIRNGQISRFFKELFAGVKSLWVVIPALLVLAALFKLGVLVFGYIKQKTAFILRFLKKNTTAMGPVENENVRRMQKLLSRFDKVMNKNKIQRPLHLTLTEFAATLEKKKMDEDILAHCHDFLTKYYHIRYGKADVEEADVMALEKALEKIE